ncbi:FUSC family protein [Pseudoroseomonas sp. WGS1072]|uniref:FUSC family protein n=1 Tax=Roseomonas sp. WGS1072 TaxID=3366816 RepID=UPI003BEF61CC
MSAAPRPSRRDDPLFSLRCALGIAIGFLLIEPLKVDPGMVLPSLLVSLLCGQRGPYTPVKTLVGMAFVTLLIWLVFALCVLTQGMLAVQFLTLLGICYLAFYLLVRSGNPLGVMLLVFTVMIGAMFGQSRLAAEAMRDAFTATAAVSALLIPCLNLLLPPRTDATTPTALSPPAVERPALQALLRLAILAPVLLAFQTIASPSDLIFVIMLALVLAYPTRQAQRTEARERISSTLLGGAAGLLILVIFTFQTHFPILLGLVFLAALIFAERMIAGRASANTYQLGLSVVAVIVAGATVDVHPLETAATRLSLTMAGVIFGLSLLSLLEWVFAAVLAPRSGDPGASARSAL